MTDGKRSTSRLNSSTDLDAYIEDFMGFVAASPTSFHAVSAAAQTLRDLGFVELREDEHWTAPLGRNFTVRDGAIIAWNAPPSTTASTPFRIWGAHSDSPGFRLKPGPSTEVFSMARASVEIYGGPLLNSWLDRELVVAGRIVCRDGSERLVRTESLMRIPQLAIHLDRDQNIALSLEKQRHLQPIWGVFEAGETVDLITVVAEAAGVPVDDIVGSDLSLAVAQAPERFGAAREFLASGRLDNLSSVFAGLRAISGVHSGADQVCVLAVFDHEEVGSESRSGAGGSFLADVLERLQAGAAVEERRRAFANSWIVSADAGHAIHPNFPEKHDPFVRPVLGGGPMLKVNAQQRYTSEAHGAALWMALAEKSEVTVQNFVSNNDVACGSTIGPIISTRTGIRTFDVGVPLLSMHSARELAHVGDLYSFAKIASAFFA